MSPRRSGFAVEQTEPISRSKREMLRTLTQRTLSTRTMSLLVTEGPHKGLQLPLEQECVRIGREVWCHLQLADDFSVSKVHCDCWIDEKGLRVRDLGSRNGTKINNVQIVEGYIDIGSTIQIGQTVILLCSDQQAKDLTISYMDASGQLIGKSERMRELFAMLPRVAERQVTTLLTGETGTGKTSIAKAIHDTRDKNAPFVTVNCGALPAGLIESELFGYVKGAFTGADKERKGLFEQADGGTLFLDEIAELPIELQPKLLDVIERRKLRRLGDTKEVDVSFHLITATHKDLEREIAGGHFRRDLYFRLSVVSFHAPALRERIEDLPLLAELMLTELSPEQPLYLSGEAMSVLCAHLWPGNIRELRNVLERSVAFLDGETIEPDDLGLSIPKGRHITQNTNKPDDITLARQDDPTPTRPQTLSMPGPSASLREEAEALLKSNTSTQSDESFHSLKEILVETEKLLLEQTLARVDYYAPEAAKRLQVSESWIYNRIKRYGLQTKRKS